ncbi:peptide deformylase [Tunicatimonas pelagia]|uniref:peptide deformylase n=1 Tax=Tunicatimonas pelagia TaxID=931531 RepID=UPI002665A156|nr:peptide deformylase [Tunicatimonas pelagia]WKN43338.1 peptide deformylase [Tunicatimonas pelagia]
MKHLDNLLLLGDPRLYQVCEPVTEDDKPFINKWVRDLHNVMEEIRAKYNFGRGIAAPQLGIMKRLFYLNVTEPQVIINPEVTWTSDEQFTLWDDCMSFPNLLVQVSRYKSLKLNYLNKEFKPQEWLIEEPEIAELVQHEHDHLNGVLCTMRAIDDKSFQWRR